MQHKLDPRYPVVWRSPTSLQIGVATTRAVVENATFAHERMVTALGAGISESGLTMVARASGADDAAALGLLAALRQVLEGDRLESPPSVTVSGTGLAALRIGEALGGGDLTVTVESEPGTGAGCDFAVAVGRFVLAPDMHGMWLRRDIPHLPVVFTDTTVTIGPIVEPGTSACLYCVQRYTTDADASWPAVSAQLWGRSAAAETPLAVFEAAAIVGRVVRARLTGRPVASTGVYSTGVTAQSSIELDVQTGAASVTEWLPHPLCGCTGLSPALSAAVPAGTGSPDAVRPGTARPRSPLTPPTIA